MTQPQVFRLIHCSVTSQNEKTALLGHTKQDYASIVRWLSFANSEILPAIAGWFCPLIGREPYNQKNVRDNEAKANKAIGVLEQHLLVNTFLVGERITLADLFTTGVMTRGYQFVFGKEWRGKYPCTTRWFETVYNQPMYLEVADKLQFIDEPVKYTPPKKEEKPKATPKAEKPKPKPKEEEKDEEDEPAPAPKPKHPLEALPKPTLVLDDWKRKYSNEETREVALPWFWENLKTDEYSLWRCDYKYNDELTMTFMTSNLIGKYRSTIPYYRLCIQRDDAKLQTQVAFSRDWKLPANTSSAVHLSLGRRITQSCKERSSSVARKRSLPLMLRLTTTATPSRSWIHPKKKTVST